MKTFLKMFFAVILAFVVMGLLGTFFIVALSSQKPKPIAKNAILEINLSGVLVDRAVDDPFSRLPMFGGGGEDIIGLNDLKDAIRAASEDDNIKGIYLELGAFEAGPALALELRQALDEFHSTGKFIYAYGENLFQNGLYLGTVADSIFAHPTGILELKGLSATIPFFKDMLSNIGIKPVVIRGSNNRFKSAVEPFLENEISEANYEQTKRFLDVFWEEWLNTVSSSRDLSAEQINAWADSLEIVTVERAAEVGLIDGVIYHSGMLKMLAEKTGKDNEKPSFISHTDYLNGNRPSRDGEKRIAVVYAEGEIVTGDGDNYTIGSDRLVKTLRKLRQDDRTDAVVLRVNSPGGSVLASEAIWDEVSQIANEKTLVVSMAHLAASGGYYISCPADSIFVQPNTITGSIGVFGLFFTAEELLTEKIDLHFSTVKTNPFADIMDPTREMTEFEQRVVQREIDGIYGRFLHRVSSGRGLDSLYVDSIAQGRVWAGKDAIRLGLADAEGGLEDAILAAASIQGLGDDYKVVEYKQLRTFEEMIAEAFGGPSATYMDLKFGKLAPYIRTLESISRREGIQARLENDLIIR
ncbi:MAG: signal peptide peptidase SppA [Bacteroidota bacterium]|nr:signal peptide peptidase SppA [Bacteroidota bacterium]